VLKYLKYAAIANRGTWGEKKNRYPTSARTREQQGEALKTAQETKDQKRHSK
jgi:hypothetical protein